MGGRRRLRSSNLVFGGDFVGVKVVILLLDRKSFDRLDTSNTRRYEIVQVVSRKNGAHGNGEGDVVKTER